MEMNYVATARDGKRFEGPVVIDVVTACHAYEMELDAKGVSNSGEIPGLKMWDRDGNRVTDVENALILHFEDCAGADEFINKAAQEFLARCDATESPCDGIDEYAFGWYYWDEYSDSYRYYDADILNTTTKLFNEYVNDVLYGKKGN